jgi:hypothetical protein
MNQQEIEDMNLRRAVRGLPEYSPPTDVWLDIENMLNREDREQRKLQEALSLLPSYEAPPMVWQDIVTALEQKPQQAKVFSITRLAIAAASVGFIATVGLWWYAMQRPSETLSYSFKTEKIDDAVLNHNQNINSEDEQAFEMVNQICAEKTFVCEQPQVQKLRNELDELNKAQTDLKDAIGLYGTDEDLQQQLLHVEQERTEVLKKIMSEI